jgi:CubicO group peptidase (beta-lactamase class C family)
MLSPFLRGSGGYARGSSNFPRRPMPAARRTNCPIVLATLLACLAAPAAAATAQPATAPAVAGYAQLDAIFADFQRENHIPGLVYGVVVDGRLIHTKSFGVQDLTARRPVTQDSLFRIASMTKAFTALGILALRDKGMLSLDAPAETYVPELKGWRYPTGDAPRIRVRDLLTHTAGFVTDDPWGDRQTPMPEAEFTKLLAAGVPFTRTPGLQMEYSNLGYALLGRVIANVSGLPYRTFVERTLLGPLGMASSDFEVSEWPIERRAIGYRWENGAWAEEPTLAHGAFGAMGGLQTSATDYARYLAWILSVVNPTLIALARQRGELNCGGLRYVAVGYGGFVQFVAPMRGGHVSLGVSEARDCKQLAIEVAGVLRRHRRTPLPLHPRGGSESAYAGAAPVPAV